MNPYHEYPGKPIILGDVKELTNSGALSLEEEKTYIVLPSGEFKSIPKNQQFMRVNATIDGLLEDLAPGSMLANRFSEEVIPEYTTALEKNPERPPYGTLVYYPKRNDLVWYAPKEWHNIALLTRNSLLIRNSKQSISWEEQREVFKNVIVGQAGASVGKDIFMRVVDTLLPDAIKIADPRTYKDTNSRRTTLSYWEIGQNKANVAAAQIHTDTPFISVSVYSEGIHTENSGDFVAGNSKLNEPAINYLIEETDDPDAKIKLRELARKYNVPTMMVTDIGVAHQIDFRDFEKNPNATLAVGISDDELLSAQEAWHKDRANRELFFKFAFKMIGDNWQSVPEFKDIVLKNINVPFAGGIPQLGIAAYKGSADLAFMIASRELGYELPERIFVNPREYLRT